MAMGLVLEAVTSRSSPLYNREYTGRGWLAISYVRISGMETDSHLAYLGLMHSQFRGLYR